MRGRVASIGLAVLPALVVLLAYAPALDAALVWDDHVLLGPRLARASVGELFSGPFFEATALRDAAPAYYRPIVLASFKLDAALFGERAAAHHGVNVLLHAIVVALAGAWARSLGARAPVTAAATLAWGLLPRLSEAVAWVSGRTDVLAAAFGFAALLAHPGAAREGAKRAREASALGLLFLALTSKETAIAVAVVLALRASKGGRARLAVPVGLWLALRTHALAGVSGEGASLTPAARAWTALEALGRYAHMSLDAWRSASSIGLVGYPSGVHVLVGAVTTVIVVAAAILARKRGALSCAATAPVALSVAALAPALHLVPLGLAGAVAADRLLYLPLAGLAIAIAVASRDAGLGSARALVLGSVALAATLAPALRARLSEYGDEVIFWTVAAERAPPSAAAPLAGLAEVIRARGRVALAARVLRAEIARLVLSGQEASARRRRAQENLGGALAFLGDYDGARRAYETALEGAGKTEPRVRLGLGHVYMHALAFDRAEEELRRAASADPRLAPRAREALAAIAEVRPRIADWGEERRRGDPFGWTEIAIRVGRVPDVERGLLARASSARLSPDARSGALTDAAALGLPDATAQALSALTRDGIAVPDEARAAAERTLSRASEVDRLAARIDALAR